MSDVRSRLVEQAGELRLAFDRAFAEEVRRDVTPTEDLLAFRAGSEPYALRLSEIAGLFVDRKITGLPGGHAALLGLAGVRGSLVPVYDLSVLLGHSPIESQHWLAVASAAPVAFAFEAFEGHVRVPHSAIAPRQAGEQSTRLIGEFASAGGVARPIVRLPFVLEAIRTLQPGAREQEGG